MNVLGTVLLSVVGIVTCIPTGPQNTVLEELIMPGVRSFGRSDSSVVFPSGYGNSRGPPDDIDVELPHVLPVYPTEHNGRGPTNDIDLVRPQVSPVVPLDPLEDEEGYVELPEWMDIDLENLSMDKMSLLNSAHNLTELAAVFGLTKEDEERLDQKPPMDYVEGPGLRFGSIRGNEIVTNAEFAGCKPDMEVVELEAPPSTLYLPQCVRLQRCGGCCTGKLLSCQPTKTEIVTLKVMKLAKNRKPGRGRSRRGARARYTEVEQINHVECGCQCRVQEHHCDRSIHEYKAAECACVCKNRAEEAKCVKKSTHFWDRRSCSCKCKRIQECSTGEEFDQNTCSCVRSSRNSVIGSRISDSKPGIPCPQCALDRAPVCGSDGRTYINHCDLDVRNCENTQDKVTKVHEGPCDRQSKNLKATSELEYLPPAHGKRRLKPVRVPLQ